MTEEPMNSPESQSHDDEVTETTAETAAPEEAVKAEAAPAAETVEPEAPTAPSTVPQGGKQSSFGVDDLKATAVKVQETLQPYWEKAQPVIKENSIRALLVSNRGFEKFADDIWPKLTQQVQTLSQKAIAAIPDETKGKVEQQRQKVQPILAKLQPIWTQGVVPAWQKFVVPNWMKLLGWLRQKLPQNLAQELTDRFLTALLLGGLLILYWFFSSLTGGAQAKPTQPAPPVQRAAPTPRVTPAVTPAVKPSPVIKPSPVAKPVEQPAPAAKAPTVIKPTPVVVPSPAPAAKVAPKVTPASPVVPAAKPAPPPTPAVDLALLKTQLQESLSAEQSALLTTVAAATPKDKLSVTLSDVWYQLPPAEQEKSAQNLMERAQKLDFKSVQLLDAEKNVIARSPIVGDRIIILKR